MKTDLWTASSRALLFACILASALMQMPAADADKKEMTWEQFVLKGNEYRERGRYFNARRVYESALRLLDRESVKDIRKALILHDIAETFRGEGKWADARATDVAASSIYKREIKAKQLGYEYSSDKPISTDGGSLRPACYICHENWKVVPILYSESTGYDGEPPPESDWKFTHKPGGKHVGDQRWYCRACQQMF